MQSDTGSRKQTIRWLSTIQQLGTGSVYCQILDLIKPGSIPMSKVNWKAKLQYESLANFKILQASILHLGLDIKLDKLIKCKYQDNFEMIQIFRRLVEKHGVPEGYRPIARRVPQLTDRKISGIGTNKQNANNSFVLQKTTERMMLNYPMTTKASMSKTISFPSSTPKHSNTTLKKTVMKKQEGFVKKNSLEIKINYFIPNKTKTDEEKLRLIKEILLRNNGQGQLKEIKNIVFDGEGEDSDNDSQVESLGLVESEEEIDVL